MSTLLKKVATATLGVLVAFSMVGGASVAQAASLTQTQIDSIVSLLESFGADAQTVADVRTTLEGGTPSGGGSGSTGSCDYTFATDLSMGDTGSDVMNLQKVLNMNSATQVASSGVGSAGNETSYFGSLTKAAVVKFQEYYAAEVLTPVGLTAGTGYVGPSTRAQLNAVCASGSTGNGAGDNGQSGNMSGLNVSAATQPANSLAPTNAARVPYTKFTLTNNGSSDVTVDSVTVERQGLANDGAFSSVVLLDGMGTQIGLTKTLNSNHQATIGDDTVIPAGSSKTFTVAANMGTIGTTYAGEVAQFAVVAINTNAAVSGSLPILGAQHTNNGSLTIGSATVDRGVLDPNASATKEIGLDDYTFQSVKVTAGSAEKIRLNSIRWNQSGSASSDDIDNVVVVVDGAEYPTTVSGDYYTAHFGNGVVIDKGLSEEIEIRADIVGGSARTVVFDIYKSTDLNVTGELYGYGISPSAGSTASASASSSQFTTGTPWYDGSHVTIQGGTFNSVSKSNAAPAANIAEQKSDEILGAFTADIKGEPITVGSLKIHITETGAAADEADVTNVSLYDGNGVLLAGPIDGSTSTELTFSTVELPVGVTTLIVKGKLGSDFANGDTIVLSTTPNSDWSDATGDDTGDSVTLPSSLATANTMTVQAASLSATTLTTPAARSLVAGTTDFIFATALLDASNSGEDVKVTALVLEDTLGDAGDDAGDIDNVEIWADLNSSDSARGDKYETRVADAEQFSDSGASDETLSITLDQHITVEKNTTVEIAVVADLASGATTGDTHRISLDTDANDVTAVALTSGQTVSVTPTGAGQIMTVSSGGTLTVTVDSSSPTAALFTDNDEMVTVGILRLAADNVEDLDVDSIKITDGGSDTVVETYYLYHGSTLLGSKTPVSGVAEFFLADGTLEVAANDHELVTVKADMNDVDTTGASNADTVQVTIAASGDIDTTGESGAAVDSTDTPSGATHTIYQAYPVFAFEDVSSTVLTTSANYLVAKIKVSNPGNEDISFDDTATANNLEIQFSGNDGGVALDETITIKDTDGTTLDSGSISSGAVAFDFSSAELTVPAGGAEYIYVYADASGLGTDGDTIQAWLDDGTAADLGFSIGTGTSNYSEADFVFKGDLFGQTHVNP